MSKRKYDDLIRRATEISEDKKPGKDVSDEKEGSNQNDKHEKSTDQIGYGIDKPFTKMTFESFDKMHIKSRPKKRRVKYEWLNFKM